MYVLTYVIVGTCINWNFRWSNIKPTKNETATEQPAKVFITATTRRSYTYTIHYTVYSVQCTL